MLSENITGQAKPGWFPFNDVLSRAQQSYATELRDVRNLWAHNGSFTDDDAYRALDTADQMSPIGAAVPYGAVRIFPVPTSVDASGKATMEAHFKLASIGMVSPRLYYLDRAQTDGKIFIGYIGKHLRNTQTN